ncbi:ABC transporter ATP-binding protein [Kitasatospora viridis]|uniref:Amino acid/amide ABC transporter ATP-binding protein 1 (HAAT family) n=1 Tax=Kitasatospora viridis TaxID=281105 RepID=A0A561SFB8_9ACTN|nr:ATP-binding cassette domain-containing protein [Kitasatospora viridis]TWF73563.1 amino acid/amide ABC transporter ATP-binding protein 1 (HAAT family) [Kitasatospora viridis]
MSAALRAEGVRRRLGGVAVLDGVDLAVPAGQVTALVGPNGAGKSVLLDCLGGAARPEAGRILLAGRDVTRAPCHRRSRLGLARTFQQVAVFPGLTVAQNLLVGAEQHGVPPAVARARTAGVLRLLGLTALAARPAAGLPLGVLRLVELARALAGAPRVLLVDEVSVGLDAAQVAWVARVLAMTAREGVGVLLVEHDLALVARLAREAYVLDAGRVVASGPVERVLADPRVRRLW